MQFNGMGKLVLFAIIIAMPFVVSTTAQLGEVAGGLDYNVSLGGTITTNSFTIVNAGNDTIGFTVRLPGFNTIPNSTAPVVTITPMNGTLPPHSELHINVSVYLPVDHNKPGYRWDGLIQVLSVLANYNTPGGATIQTGVGKELIVTATAQQYNWPLIAIGVIAVGLAGYLIYKKYGKGRGKKKGRKGLKMNDLSSMLKGKSKARRGGARGKRTARRSAKRRTSRKRRRR